MQKQAVVAVNVAIIDQDNKLLIAKRSLDKPMPEKWEFPGGKLEENETLEACGVREIREELALDIEIESYLGYENLDYMSKAFVLHFFTARLRDPNQQFVLHEHSDARWLAFDQLSGYDFPARDLEIMDRIKEAIEG